MNNMNFNLKIPFKFCSISCTSSLSGPSIKKSACHECEPHTHPFLRCSQMSVSSKKRIAEALLELTQKCTSRKGKIDLSKKTQKGKNTKKDKKKIHNRYK